jgi:hypothetical protein
VNVEAAYYSQGCFKAQNMLQDKFVCEFLNFKKNGTFLDIGCNEYQKINNTYYMEKNLNWNGIGIDIDPKFQNDWQKHRKSPYIIADATVLDYQKLLTNNNMPYIIDYLSLDLEPPTNTLLALKKVFESKFLFNIITYETDFYRERSTREPSRKLMLERDYVLIHETEQDDFYVYKRLVKFYLKFIAISV